MGINRNRIKNHKPLVIDSLDLAIEKDEIKDNVDMSIEIIEDNIDTIDDAEDISSNDLEVEDDNQTTDDEDIEIIDKEEVEETCGYKKVFTGIPIFEINGVKVTEDNKQYMSDDGLELKDITEDTIICITTMKIYDDNKIANKETGANASSIKKCCNGNAKSAGKDENGNKLTWEFLINYLKNND